MRVLVIHEYNLPYGGGESYVHSTCEALREMGHRVALVCAQERNQGFLSADACYGIERSVGFRTGRRVLPSLDDILRRERPDLVFLNGLGRFFISPYVIARIVRHWPTVSFVHHLDLVCPTGRKVVPGDHRLCERPAGHYCISEGCIRSMGGPPLDRLRGAAITLWRMREMRRCRRVIVPSEYVRRECIRNGFSARGLCVLPCFTTKGRRATNDPEGLQVLWVGRVDDGKGLDFFLRALTLLPGGGWKAVVVGDGPGLDGAVDMGKDLGLADHVVFRGRVVGEELDACYASSRLLVFTSTWAETFGQVGIEAMALGRPAVAFNAGGTTEWLEEGRTGFLVPLGDCARMAERIALLLDDDRLWHRMSAAARERVDERFRPEQHFPRLVQIFEEAVRLHRRETTGVTDVP